LDSGSGSSKGDRHQELAAAYPAQFGHAGREDLRRDVFEDLHAGDDIEAVVLEVQRVDAAVGAIDEVGELDILAEPGLIDAGDDVVLAGQRDHIEELAGTDPHVEDPLTGIHPREHVCRARPVGGVIPAIAGLRLDA